MSARFVPQSTAPVPERALLVGVDLGRGAWSLDDSLAELGRLAETDGAVVVGTLSQRLDAPNPRTFIGSGKVAEVVEQVRALSADVVVFDDELTPSQQANLEKTIGKPTKVIDRTALILDIFGQHATTHEGRLQVQLAQLQYVYPRLRGMWGHLVGEQTRGGIGSRFGQGESQLEVDRRLIRNRIAQLRRELARLEVRRGVQSRARWDSGVFRVALVGYTNAGKSTLLNQLTGAGVFAHDELFATLDPTTRSLALSEGRKVTITDTVGFIQKLPTTLVEAFKSTLAEVVNADLVLEVVDATDRNRDLQMEAVEQVLADIEAAEIPRLVVYNKCDLLDGDARQALRQAHPGDLVVSARDGEGMGSLRHAMAREASRGERVLTVLLPYERGSIARMAHERCRVVSARYVAEGTLLTVSADERMAAVLAPYAVGEGTAPEESGGTPVGHEEGQAAPGT